MKRLEFTLDKIRPEIRNFYKPNEHHFIVMNGVDLGDKMEVQWLFANYAPPGDVTMFASHAQYDDVIPTINDFVNSAWVTEAEFYDLFDVKVDGAKKGFVLESDSEVGPLRRSK